MPPKKNLQQSSSKLQVAPSGGGGAKKSKKLLPNKSATGKGGKELPSGVGSTLKIVNKETGNTKSPQGSETNISLKATPSPSQSLIKKKKKKKGEEGTKPVEDTSGAPTASPGPGELDPGNPKKGSLNPSDNPLKSPTGSYKQKLFNKLLKNKPAPVHDEENQDAAAKDGAAAGAAPPPISRNKKVWGILAAILLILLIIIIFAILQGGKGQGSKGGDNMTSTSMATSTGMPTTSTTGGPTGYPTCPGFPGIKDPAEVGKYCKSCFFGPFCTSCCETYYGSGSSDLATCEGFC